MALVSMAAFGEMHGSSKQAVSKWKAKGALKICLLYTSDAADE